MNFPADLRYTEEHEWIKIESGNVALVGITDFAQSELGDIVFVEIETEGDNLEENDIFGTIEAVKTVSDLFLPVAGKVLEVNPSLSDEPELVNNSPYEGGWLIRMEVSDMSDLEKLMDADSYKSSIGH
ncbi:glycine cleavage system protein GcvH [Lacihabitans sp. CCS-44]|uniref:glycine cleavage system protein GcvH n=1 Tax=Lacihabitans sp. CCS-44 TaxID=2487331 RepID=UPI0020CFC1E0|nr:glycine cleavage system protein GcvH [Lacihabitans sp. CCS-44]MCP9755920.1 glycine cleavage system protein GcvH [Lacihabitans sp. CCS-44]